MEEFSFGFCFKQWENPAAIFIINIAKLYSMYKMYKKNVKAKIKLVTEATP
jgi:hypothetical protein